MKIYHFIAAVALATATLCSCGNQDNYPDVTERVIAIQGDGVSEGALKLKAGETCQLKGIIEPRGTEEGEIFWVSENPEVATVSEDGVVTAVNNGITTIAAIEDRTPVYGKGVILVEVYGGSVEIISDDPVDQSEADAPKM